MIKIEIYNPNKTYALPDGTEMTSAAFYAKRPAAQHMPYVVETDSTGVMMAAVIPLSVLADKHNVEYDAENIDGMLSAIQDALNAPQPEPEPSAEERIAAALEFQNLMTMPEV